MALRTRHPRLVSAACRTYGAVLWLYPTSLRRDFRDELVITFRNCAEDALTAGRPLTALFFIARIGADLIRSFTVPPPAPQPRLSMLGLAGTDDEACGCLDRSAVDGSLFFAALGVVLMFVGWYGYMMAQSTYLGHHRL